MLAALGEDDRLEKASGEGEGMRVGKCEERDAGGTVGERDPCSEGDEGREI